MFACIAQNLATILISIGLFAVVAGVCVYLIRSKKNGKSAGCGCGCSGCPGAAYCHKQ